MVKEGRALGEQGAPLQAAANVLNQFVFGSQNFTPPRICHVRSDPEEQNRAATDISSRNSRRVYETV